MSYVIKITHQGFDVNDLDKKQSPKNNNHYVAHIISILALSYLNGAKTQLVRYKKTTTLLESQTVPAIMQCLHEVSTLFEDLNTVAQYLEKISHTHTLHKLWTDVRNHIRHDCREEFDNDNSLRKNGRAKNLKLDPKLQTDIEFKQDVIKFGKTEIRLVDVTDYLDWAEKEFSTIITQAKKNGRIK